MDCQLGPWSEWSECSADCGAGIQYRTREVLQYPSNGGTLCGDTIEYRECNLGECEGACSDPVEVISLQTPIDPNPVNTAINANALVFGAIAEASWDWGDGFVSTETTASETISATHTYTEAGVYRVQFIVTDTCGNTDTAVSEYIPVYDPNGGFVTGGGWIWSPAGAYKNDLTLEGKASFGFVAKYKKGSNVPDGHTEFHFRAGNLNFNSTSYDAMRLIISGAKAQFKGIGTINGTGNYGFMISVVDEALSGSSDQDRFRIKIWDLDNDGAIVYDNNIEQTDENAEPATNIGGGSIIIHKLKGNKSAEIPASESVFVTSVNAKVWPNPFSERLEFEFSSPVQTHVVLDLYEINGRKIKTLYNGPIQENETINLEYFPEGLVSQMIVYRLRIGDEIFTEKIIYKKNK